MAQFSVRNAIVFCGAWATLILPFLLPLNTVRGVAWYLAIWFVYLTFVAWPSLGRKSRQ